MTSHSLLASCLTLTAVLAAFAAPAHGGDAPTPAAPAAPAPALDVLRIRLHGAVDGPAVAAAIAAELGVPTAVVTTDAACTAPCVAVTVDDRARASIAVVLSSATHQRVIELPAAPTAAAEVIALVVGNLARDEAATLLAELAPPTIEPDVAPPIAPAPAHATTLGIDASADVAPAAPPAIDDAPADATAPSAPVLAPPASAAAPATAARRAAPPRAPETPTRFALGLIPPLAFDVEGARGAPGGVAIDLVLGGRRRLAAFNVAGVGSIVTEQLTGTQIGGAFTAAGRVDGAQIAGALTIAGPVRGSQIAGAVAVAGPLRGTQIAGALAVAGPVRGAQIAGAAAISSGDVSAQIGGAVAIAGGDVGTQIAGALNVAGGEVDGAQLGTVNVARRVDGLQVGVVNIAGGGDGVSIGLLNLVAGGRTEVEATIDQRALGTVVLRHGSRRWHNVYGVGGTVDRALVDDDVTTGDVWMYGLGMGPSWQRGQSTIDLEAMAWHVVYGADFDSELDLLSQLRLVVGHPIGPATLVVGAAANVYITSDERRDAITALPRMTVPPVADGDVHVRVWPSAFIGLRL